MDYRKSSFIFVLLFFLASFTHLAFAQPMKLIGKIDLLYEYQMYWYYLHTKDASDAIFLGAAFEIDEKVGFKDCLKEDGYEDKYFQFVGDFIFAEGQLSLNLEKDFSCKQLEEFTPESSAGLSKEQEGQASTPSNEVISLFDKYKPVQEPIQQNETAPPSPPSLLDGKVTVFKLSEKSYNGTIELSSFRENGFEIYVNSADISSGRWMCEFEGYCTINNHYFNCTNDDGSIGGVVEDGAIRITSSNDGFICGMGGTIQGIYSPGE